MRVKGSEELHKVVMECAGDCAQMHDEKCVREAARHGMEPDTHPLPVTVHNSQSGQQLPHKR